MQSERLRLAAFTQAHLENENYLAWLRDYDVVKTLNKVDYLRPVSYEEVQAYCHAVMQSASDMYFAIELLGADKFIGTVRVSKLNWHALTADIGIMIGDKSEWGQGYASEAINVIASHLFDKLGLRRLTAGMMAVNPAMVKAFVKSGFVQEGVWRQHDYFEGEYVDHIYLGCLQHEFKRF